MDSAALAQAILTHPLTWCGVTLVAAPLCAWVAALQLRAIGLAPRAHERSGIAWHLVLAFLVGWLVLLGGLSGVAGMLENSLLDGMLFSVFTTVLAMLPAAAILAGADRHRRNRLEEARDQSQEVRDRTQQELRWVQYAALALAAVAVINGALLFPLLLVAFFGGALWWLLSPRARAHTRSWNQSYRAGQRLRTRLPARAVIESPEGELVLVGSVGLLSTDVLDEGKLRVISNVELLERTEGGMVLEPRP
jgi:hypothetical protein